MPEMPQVDLKPLKQRQDECNAFIKERVPADLYASLVMAMSTDRLRFTAMAIAMKRECWERFWSVFRDTIEAEAERFLTLAEAPKKPPNIFD